MSRWDVIEEHLPENEHSDGVDTSDLLDIVWGRGYAIAVSTQGLGYRVGGLMAGFRPGRQAFETRKYLRLRDAAIEAEILTRTGET